MTTTNQRRRTKFCLALLALSVSAASGMQAQCRVHNTGSFVPGVGSLHDPAGPDQEDSSDQPSSPEVLNWEKEDSNITVLGLWKKVYFAGGALNDVGFAQFNAGGTELLNDTGALDSGNNFCIGAWKRVGARTYRLVHTFFVFDGSGKKVIAIAIEKSQLTVDREGNTFAGKWSQDNYDLAGNLVPETHFEGRIRGTRIAPELPFPFPFPF